jgi:hypothetical protein
MELKIRLFILPAASVNLFDLAQIDHFIDVHLDTLWVKCVFINHKLSIMSNLRVPARHTQVRETRHVNISQSHPHRTYVNSKQAQHT